MLLSSYWHQHRSSLVNASNIPLRLLSHFDKAITANKRLSSEDFLYAITKKGHYYQLERTPETFSYYNAANRSSYSNKIYRLDDFITDIRTSELWATKLATYRDAPTNKQGDIKKSLPCITVSAEIFKGNDRQKLSLGQYAHTHLIQCDFDSPGMNVPLLLSSLYEDHYIRCAFRSPSLKVKAFIKVSPIEDLTDHKSAFAAVQEHCRSRYNLEIDRAPSAINSLCYISSDPDTFIKEADALPWESIAASSRVDAPVSAQSSRSINKIKKRYIHRPIGSVNTDIDLGLFLQKLGIETLGDAPYGKGTMYYVRCPWVNNHGDQKIISDYDTGVFTLDSGKWAFVCFHNTCKPRSWKEFRAASNSQEKE